MRPIEHGTDRAGYREHLRRNEPVCEPCRLAHNAYERLRTGGRVRELAPCGSEAAFRRHHRRQEKPCPACRAAHAEYERGRSAKQQGAA